MDLSIIFAFVLISSLNQLKFYLASLFGMNIIKLHLNFLYTKKKSQNTNTLIIISFYSYKLFKKRNNTDTKAPTFYNFIDEFSYKTEKMNSHLVWKPQLKIAFLSRYSTNGSLYAKHRDDESHREVNELQIFVWDTHSFVDVSYFLPNFNNRK